MTVSYNDDQFFISENLLCWLSSNFTPSHVVHLNVYTFNSLNNLHLFFIWTDRWMDNASSRVALETEKQWIYTFYKNFDCL